MSAMDILMEAGIEVSEPQTGFFAEAGEALDSLTKQLQVNLMKGQMITESVERELALNIAQAELKCMKEHGTADDLMYLEEAAEEGAAAKLKSIINKIIQMWKDFCTNIRNKVMSKICSAEARATLSKAEKKIKLNPILARKKVEVPKIDKAIGVINKYKSKVDKIAAKTIKSLGGEHTAKTLQDTKDEFRSEFNHAIAGTAATAMITVAALVAELNTQIDKLPHFVDNCERVTCVVLDKLNATVSDESAAAATAMTQACANFRTELAKEELNQHFSYVMDLMAALKKAVLKAQGKHEIKDPELKEESYEDFDYRASDDEIFGESMEEDLDDSFIDDLLNGID